MRKFKIIFLVTHILIVEVLGQQKWSTFYTFNGSNSIDKIAVNEAYNELAISDGSILLIANHSKGVRFSEQSYKLGTKTYSVKYANSNISDLTYHDGELFVATRDSHILSYDELANYGGLPIYIINARNRYIGDYLASFIFLGKKYVGEIDVYNKNFRCYEGGVDCPLYNEYEIGDIGINTQDVLAIVNKKKNNLIIPNYGGQGNSIRYSNINFPNTAFTLLKEVEISALLQQRTYFWMSTDKGMALMSSGSNTFNDIINKPDIKMHTSKNSFFKSEDIRDIEVYTQSYSGDLDKTTFFAFSNKPSPTVYIFNATGTKYCLYNSVNSPLNALTPITDICHSIDNLFVAQGKNIFRLNMDNFNAFKYCSNNTTTPVKELIGENISIYPNPTKGIINFKGISHTLSKKIELYNTLGQKIPFDFVNDNSIEINNVDPGIYYFNVAGYSKKIILY